MTVATSQTPPRVRRTVEPGTRIPFDVVSTRGAYVCDWSGHLLRVSEVPGRTPPLNIIGSEPLTVTKLSDDPDVPLAIAKQLAMDMNIPTHF